LFHAAKAAIGFNNPVTSTAVTALATFINLLRSLSTLTPL
jgi:hypothetical protein